MRLDDRFCTYRGEKYRTYDAYDNGLQGGTLRTWICTDDPHLADGSFIEDRWVGWKKTVNLRELEDVYDVETYGIYRGRRVGIRGGSDRLQYYIICSGDEALAREWGMDDPPDRGEGYQKRVPWEEVELVQIRENRYWDGECWMPLEYIALSDLSLAVRAVQRWTEESLWEEMQRVMESWHAEERGEMILALEKMGEEKGKKLTAEDLSEMRKRLGIG